MKILFVSPEFEEQARGITGIIRAMIRASKDAGHEVGILAGYPNSKLHESDLLDAKVEHINLQHYLNTGKKDVFPKHMNSKKTQLKILLGRKYLASNQFSVEQKLISDKRNIANDLDFVIKIPFCYHFMNHGYGALPKKVLRSAVKKSGVDLVITGAPVELTKKDVAPAKLAQFVHDTMPIDMLETPADNNTPYRFAKQFHAAAAESDLVFANSMDTKNKVLEVNPEAKVKVVYGTASAVPGDSPETAVLKTLGLEKDNYLMFVSVIEKRKNVQGLIDAYSLIYEKLQMPLVIAGGKGFGYEEILNHYNSLAPEIKQKIIFTGFLSENDKYMLLKNARTFTFPSFYEGIGLQIIEALSSRLPVVTSRKGALPEAGGDHAYYVDDPYNVREIADAIYKVSTDDKVRSELLKDVDTHVEKFTSANFNKRFKDGLEKIS
jgi:glycosyltransferase involved in cell wall biosynthesis